MSQFRYFNFGDPVTAKSLQVVFQGLFQPGIYSGFNISVTGPQQISLDPGFLLLPSGIGLQSDTSIVLSTTTPAFPTVFTVVVQHQDVDQIGGTQAVFSILTGFQPTPANGIPIGYINHPGIVALSQSFIVPVPRLQMPFVINDQENLQPVVNIAPFENSVNDGIPGMVTLAGSDANGGVTYIALSPRASSNAIQVRHVQAGLSTPLSVSVVGTQITINLQTNAIGGLMSTATQVAAAVNASGPASALVVALFTGTGGSLASPAGFTNLSGGTDPAGPDITITESYDVLNKYVVFNVNNGAGAVGAESYAIETQFIATPRPPTRLTYIASATGSNLITVSLFDTTGRPVLLTPNTIGPTLGWETHQLLVSPGTFTPGKPYILITKFTVAIGQTIKLNKIMVEFDPVITL